MTTSCVPSQFLLCKKATYSFKGFSFFSLVFFSLLVFVCLILFFFSGLSSGFLFLIVMAFSLFYSKFQHQNSSQNLEEVSILQVMMLVYYIIRNRETARTLILNMVCGTCLCFAKQGMVSFDFVTQKFMLVHDPDIVETILSSSAILQKGFPYGLTKDLLKEGLITSGGSLWHSRRKLLTPAFHFRILKEFTPVFNKQAKCFVTKIENLMEKQGSFDIVPLARLCTMDIILETAMGKTMDGEEEHVKEYFEAFETWNSCFSKRVIYPFLWPDFIFSRTKIGKASRKSVSIMEQFTRKVITERLRKRSERPKDMMLHELTSENDEIGRKAKHQLALLDLLLDLHMQDKNSLSLEDIEGEVATFVLAGHDTTTAAIGYTLYLLGLHPEIQRNVQEEVDMVLGDDVDRTITDADIKKFKYLSCVLKETMRLYPSVHSIGRRVQEDTVINGKKIRKGTSISIPIYLMHRNPEIFPNPEKFDPERFSLKNVNNRHPFVYIPFSAGSRNCIGQRFAINALIVVLATVLRHFDISSVEHRDKLKLLMEIVLATENGLHLKFTKRQMFRNYSS